MRKSMCRSRRKRGLPQGTPPALPRLRHPFCTGVRKHRHRTGTACSIRLSNRRIRVSRQQRRSRSRRLQARRAVMACRYRASGQGDRVVVSAIARTEGAQARRARRGTLPLALRRLVPGIWTLFRSTMRNRLDTTPARFARLLSAPLRISSSHLYVSSRLLASHRLVLHSSI